MRSARRTPPDADLAAHCFVRIASWNLNCKLRDGAEALLLDADADILLLTEAPPDLALDGYHVTPVGPLMARGQQWASIASRQPLEPVSSPHPATTAAVVGGTTFVCSVLPWGPEQGVPLARPGVRQSDGQRSGRP